MTAVFGTFHAHPQLPRVASARAKGEDGEELGGGQGEGQQAGNLGVWFPTPTSQPHSSPREPRHLGSQSSLLLPPPPLTPLTCQRSQPFGCLAPSPFPGSPGIRGQTAAPHPASTYHQLIPSLVMD